MRAMLPKTEETEGEKKRFSRAAKRLRSRRWKRLCAWVCAGVVLALTLLLGVYQVVNERLTNVLSQPMKLADYEVTLSAMQNGRCVTSIRQEDPRVQSALSIIFVPTTDGMTEYVGLNTAILPQKDAVWQHDAQWDRTLSWDENGLYYMEDGEHVPVTRVYKGRPDDCTLVYLRGNDIVLASAGMEEYFTQWDAYEQMRNDPESDERSSKEPSQRFVELYNLTVHLEKLVTEWNTGIKTPNQIEYPVMTPPLVQMNH